MNFQEIRQFDTFDTALPNKAVYYPSMRPLANIPFLILTTLLIIACSESTNISKVLLEPFKEAKVVRIVDGDTIDVLIDGTKQRVRLFGVDTPERGEPCYNEATERTRQLSGEVVRIEAGPRTEDRYGRLLFYLYTESGESIDTQLIQEGLATAWTRDGQHRDLLVNAETEARRKNAGCLW